MKIVIRDVKTQIVVSSTDVSTRTPAQIEQVRRGYEVCLGTTRYSVEVVDD